MDQGLALNNPLLEDLPLPIARPVVRPPNLNLPKGATIVSADGHWEVTSDIFYERLPKGLRERAPRVHVENGLLHYGLPNDKGEIIDFLQPDVMEVSVASSNLAGMTDLAARVAHMDAEQIDYEVNFPHYSMALVGLPDFEMKEAVYRVYNEYVAERSVVAKGRCHGVGILSNWWDPAKAESAVQQIVDLGLRTFMVPCSPGRTPDGNPIVYSEPASEKLWSAIAASGLPVCFHVGEGVRFSGRGGLGILTMSSLKPFNTPLGQLIFGGIFDRHPDLQVIFAEAGIAWVPVALQDAEIILDTFRGLHNYTPKRRPSEYWAENCYATFMNDPLGLEMIHHIGADRVMWSSDYPHAEGTFGYSQGSMQSVVNMVSEADARKILGGTAMRLFKL